MEGQRVTTVASMGQNDVNPEQMAASHQVYDVFLCHAGENKAFVRQLVDRLGKDGLKKERIFYDEISLQPGDVLDSIIKVIESPSLKLFVFVVSKYCFKSNKTWIRAEWEAALENNKQIFPIWLDDNDDGFKAFGNLVREFSYKLRKIIAHKVNLQEVSTSFDGLSKKICSLLIGEELTQRKEPPSANAGLSSTRPKVMPALEGRLEMEKQQAESIVKSLQGEVTRLTEKNEEAKKASEEARKALMRKTEEINELQKTIRGLEAKIEAMEAAKTKMDTPGRGGGGGRNPQGFGKSARVSIDPNRLKFSKQQFEDGNIQLGPGGRPGAFGGWMKGSSGGTGAKSAQQQQQQQQQQEDSGRSTPSNRRTGYQYLRTSTGSMYLLQGSQGPGPGGTNTTYRTYEPLQ